MRRLLACTLAAAGSAAAVTLAVALVSWAGFVHGFVPGWEGELLRHQLRKLDAAAPADVVLLGDSSLGNAIDAARWSRQLGHPVLSLALSGDFGYPGSLNMLRRVLRHWTPRLVVVMQTTDMATRPTPYWSDLVTAGRLADIEPAAVLPGLLQLYRSHAILDMLQGHDGSGIAAGDDAWVRDYVRQGPSLMLSGRKLEGHDRLLQHRLHDDNAPFLASIAAVCRASRIACVYMSGPIVEPLCGESVARVRATDALVAAAGLRVVAGAPLCIPLADVGDAADHVAPRARDRFSDRYLALLRASGALASLDDGSGTGLPSAGGDVAVASQGLPLGPVEGEPPS